MLLRLFLLFTLVPLAELTILLWIAHRTGWLFTLALVIVTGVVGASLARREGLRCWQGARQRLAQGEMPTDSLLDGLMILLAGALLITPGVLTDLFGFSLLLPPARRVFRRWLSTRLKARVTIVNPFSGPTEPGHDQILDAHVIDTTFEDPSSPDRTP
ncbi:MAG: FxsA family protein [Pirellulales bacterium]|nr:FxsA family protein [Pirellulales bacterium]